MTQERTVRMSTPSSPQASTHAGRVRLRTHPAGSLAKGTHPLTGNHPRRAAKNSMHSTASQKPGTAPASCIIVRDTTSTTPPGRRADTHPSTRAAASASTVAYTARASVTGSVEAMTPHTGAE